MISPDIEQVKDEVDDEVTEAFKEFCKNRVRELKASLHNAQEQETRTSDRVCMLEDKLRNLNIEELRKRFFEQDVCTQSSPYEKVLKQ